MKSLATTALCLMAGVMPMHAEEDKPTVHLNLQTRASYVNDRIGSEVQHDASGMKGDYLFLSLYGNINDRLSYNWRQRVNSKITRNDIFEATDWIYIDYKLTKNWAISAGKQVIMVGSWEYDRNPIDIYTPSEYWNNVAPFKFGASIAYNERQRPLPRTGFGEYVQRADASRPHGIQPLLGWQARHSEHAVFRKPHGIRSQPLHLVHRSGQPSGRKQRFLGA